MLILLGKPTTRMNSYSILIFKKLTDIIYRSGQM